MRASFNIDSSVDNSNANMDSIGECSNQNQNLLTIGLGLAPIKKGNAISTPCVKRLNRFQCALSPITGMKLDGLQIEVKRAVSENGKLYTILYIVVYLDILFMLQGKYDRGNRFALSKVFRILPKINQNVRGKHQMKFLGEDLA